MAMSINRILLIAAVVLFVLVALSAFSTRVNLNELGWLALGLAAYAASQFDFPAGRTFGGGGGGGPRRRSRLLG